MSNNTKNHALDFLHNFEKLIADLSIQAVSAPSISPDEAGGMVKKINSFIVQGIKNAQGVLNITPKV